MSDARDYMSYAQLGPFYHGNAERLQPGAVIKPAGAAGHPGNHIGYDTSQHTYSTMSVKNAEGYAVDAANNRFGGTGDMERDRRAIRANTHIYEVQHIGQKEDAPNDVYSWRSKAPLRVVREIPRDEYGWYNEQDPNVATVKNPRVRDSSY